MSKKKRDAKASLPPPPPPTLSQSAASSTPSPTLTSVRTSDAPPGDWTVVLIALMLFLAPTLGAPNEELLQDTLKSIVVCGLALGAWVIFSWRYRHGTAGWRWHPMLALPLGLCAYALGSMVWSHAFLGGVEAIRWFVLSVVVWLLLQSASPDRFKLLAWGIHGGALGAACWTALQFWFDFKGFPQGPNPASTFVNRNFVAEFLVCTLPFSTWLVLRTRGTALIALVSLSAAFNLVAMLMTGTRSALIALGVMALLTPVFVWQTRTRWAPGLGGTWTPAERWVAIGVLLVTVVGLGNITTGNAALIEEHRVEARGLTALERGFSRAMSMTDQREYTERSFSLRWVMWAATTRMIAARPLSGVGAGAWEVDIPLYQVAGAQLETDYYVHNEILQLLAEYGLVGWLFLLGLLSYLIDAAWRTWRDRRPEALAEAPMRAATLTSLLTFLVISNAGFPWRLAATGALFAVCLGVLAASDARLGWQVSWRQRALKVTAWRWQAGRAQALLGVSLVSLALCAYISHQAVEAESKIVRAVRLALTITASQRPHLPRWNATKNEMLQLLKEGVAINRHYRKLTPMVADELAKWGDWENATAIWASIDQSRPHVVAIMTNIARGYSIIGQVDKAWPYLARCKQLQPRAPSVRSLEVILLARTGKPIEALALIQASMDEHIIDYDLVTAAHALGVEQRNWKIALQGLALRAEHWPASAPDSWLKAGLIYADSKADVHDPALALQAFQKAYALAPIKDKDAVRADVPSAYQSSL